MISRNKTLRPMSQVFDVSVPDTVMVEVFDRTPFVPAIEPAYTFEKASLKRVLQWLHGGFGKNLLLTGPTGCGKSSLIEQVCARLGIEVFRVACHGKLEYPELIASVQLVSAGAMANSDGGLLQKASLAIKALFKGSVDGESLLEWLQRSLSSGTVTRVVYGPAVEAARRGAVLLLDEGNFLHPSTFGAFNTLLDGGTIAIPDTGEVINPHESFRLAVTGNSFDGGDDSSLHRGVQRMNVALLNRFLTLRCDYMSKLQEAQVLGKTCNLPGPLTEAILNVVADVRDSFKSGALETVVSTRVIIRWAKLVQANYAALSTPQAEDAIVESLDFALLDAANPTDAETVRKLVRKAIGGRVFVGPASASTPTAPSNPAAPAPLKTLRVFVHENSGNPKVWGGLTSSMADEIFYGSIGDAGSHESKALGYIERKAPEKIGKGYMEIKEVSCRSSQEFMLELAKTWNMVSMGSQVTVADPHLRDAFKELLNYSNKSQFKQLIN